MTETTKIPHNKRMHRSGNRVAHSLRSSTSTPRPVILNVRHEKMKYLLANQIPGYRSKSRKEKKHLRKLAQKSRSFRIALVIFTIFLVFILLFTRAIGKQLLEPEVLWFDFCVAVLFGLIGRVFVTGFVENPEIAKILKRETETEQIKCPN